MKIEVKLPEGAKVDEKVLDEFKAIFADPNLDPSKRAQAVLDWQVRQAQAREKSYAEAIKAADARNLEMLKNDPDYGGHQFEQTKAAAEKVARLVFGDDVAKELGPFGMHNAPWLIKGLARIGRLISEDSIAGTIPKGPQQDPQKEWRGTFYDHPTSQQAMNRR